MRMLVTITLVGLVLAIAVAAWSFWHDDGTARAPVQLKPGEPAPSFQLSDADGVFHRLADYRGHWLVLYFYPKDDTPGCTREACHFRDDIAAIQNLGASVVGISLDDAASHRAFSSKYHLPFTLLSDPNGRVAAAYGSLLKIGPLAMARRHTFIIDPQGRIAKIYRKVQPAKNAAQVVAELKRLQAGETPGHTAVPKG